MDLRFMPKLCAQADACSVSSCAMFFFQKAYFLLVCAEAIQQAIYEHCAPKR